MGVVLGTCDILGNVLGASEENWYFVGALLGTFEGDELGVSSMNVLATFGTSLGFPLGDLDHSAPFLCALLVVGSLQEGIEGDVLGVTVMNPLATFGTTLGFPLGDFDHSGPFLCALSGATDGDELGVKSV